MLDLSWNFFNLTRVIVTKITQVPTCLIIKYIKIWLNAESRSSGQLYHSALKQQSELVFPKSEMNGFYGAVERCVLQLQHHCTIQCLTELSVGCNLRQVWLPCMDCLHCVKISWQKLCGGLWNISFSTSIPALDFKMSCKFSRIQKCSSWKGRGKKKQGMYIYTHIYIYLYIHTPVFLLMYLYVRLCHHTTLILAKLS